MATRSSLLAWRIPWTEESGGLQSRGWYGVRHTTERLTLSLSFHYLRKLLTSGSLPVQANAERCLQDM